MTSPTASADDRPSRPAERHERSRWSLTDEVLDGLRRAPHHSLVVVRDDRVVGELTLADVLHLLDEAPTVAGPPMPLPPTPPPPTTSHQIWRHLHGR